MAEFYNWDTMYPGYLPTANLTFYPDGTFVAFDNLSGGTGGGFYERRGSNIEITLVPDGPYGTVQYVGTKVAQNVYEGEIRVDGICWGYWRGDL